MKLTEAITLLKTDYYVEHDMRFLYVREKVNSFPVKLSISWLTTVSDRTVNRLLNNRPMTRKNER